jgi:hypothetical protein
MSTRHRDPQASNLERENERLCRELAAKDRQIRRQAEEIAEQRAAQTELHQLLQAAFLRWTGKATRASGAGERRADGRWVDSPAIAERIGLPRSGTSSTR